MARLIPRVGDMYSSGTCGTVYVVTKLIPHRMIYMCRVEKNLYKTDHEYDFPMQYVDFDLSRITLLGNIHDVGDVKEVEWV